jgi:hypothetical protein
MLTVNTHTHTLTHTHVGVCHLQGKQGSYLKTLHLSKLCRGYSAHKYPAEDTETILIKTLLITSLLITFINVTLHIFF